MKAETQANFLLCFLSSWEDLDIECDIETNASLVANNFLFFFFFYRLNISNKPVPASLPFRFSFMHSDNQYPHTFAKTAEP